MTTMRFEDRTRCLVRKSRTSLLSGLLAFAVLQAGLVGAVECWLPEVRDAEFGYKLARLRNLVAKSPDRPLVISLGSSRTQLGFRPSVVTAACAAADRDAVAFNFGLV